MNVAICNVLSPHLLYKIVLKFNNTHSTFLGQGAVSAGQAGTAEDTSNVRGPVERKRGRVEPPRFERGHRYLMSLNLVDCYLSVFIYFYLTFLKTSK